MIEAVLERPKQTSKNLSINTRGLADVWAQMGNVPRVLTAEQEDAICRNIAEYGYSLVRNRPYLEHLRGLADVWARLGKEK